jgi:Holliday junction resolvase RusA-like endonuclease
MTTIRLTVPGEPRGKGRPRFARRRQKGGGIYLASIANPETEMYENLIAVFAKNAGAIVAEGPVSLRIAAHVGIPPSASKKRQAAMRAGIVRPTKKPDLDNIVKAVCDGLNKVAWKDDVQVVTLVLEKHWSDEPRLEIEICPVVGINQHSDGNQRDKAA